MQDDFEIGRRQDGSIDTDRYVDQAVRERRAAIADAVRAMRNGLSVPFRDRQATLAVSLGRNPI